MFGKSPGSQYIEVRGKTYERENWSKSKKEMKQRGKDLKSGFFGGVSSYRVRKSGKYWILYVR
mgnify:CR=1 FL=1